MSIKKQNAEAKIKEIKGTHARSIHRNKKLGL